MAEGDEVMNLALECIGDEQPVKQIRNVDDLQQWYRSEAYYDLVSFINGISTAIQGYQLKDQYYNSPNMEKLLEMFDKFNEMIDSSPPMEQPQRFGNKSYRAWWRKMNHDIFHILEVALPTDKCGLISELGFYLSESFGNAVRIDYGTGHELSFIFFMCALFKGGVLTEEDSVAAGLGLFYKYLMLVRRLQTTYRMEPAGSHGVWSLDDYQFIPFIWGSAQLACHSPFSPHKFLDDDIIDGYSDNYMFISCIRFIREVKTGHFAEHSNQLWSISAVPSWIKINSGLVKMYQKDVLAKYPIMQHMYFSPLMPFTPVKPGARITGAYLGEQSEVALKNMQHLQEARRTTTGKGAKDEQSNVQQPKNVRVQEIADKRKASSPTGPIAGEESREFEVIEMKSVVSPTDEGK